MALGLWALVVKTDLTSKLVLLILLGMSIASWAIAIYKRMLTKVKRESLSHAKNLLKNTKSMDDFLTRVAVIQTTYAGELLAGFLSEFKKIIALRDAGLPISEVDWNLLGNSLQQRIEDAVTEEEALIPVLTTSAQAAPLIGLFGTVWGLIHAFMEIATQRTADIAAVAPGIAEALLTTLGGLLVAIPTLGLISYLYNNSRLLEQDITEIADTCTWVMRTIIQAPSKTAHAASVATHKEQEVV